MSPDVEERIGRLAARQHGVVTRRQLLDSGLTPGRVQHRIRRGGLVLLHRGVYSVLPVPRSRAREMAAVLACGDGAVISRRCAGVLWKALPDSNDEGPVHVTAPGGDRGRRPGIRVRRVRYLPREDVTRVEGIPVTTPTRTLLDLAADAARRDTDRGVGPRELEQAVARAERQGLVDPAELLQAIECHPRPRGGRLLRALLEREGGPAFTRSRAEERFLDLVRKAQLPAPEVNARVGRYEVDFLWRVVQVIVEVDGRAYHSSETHFERDRERDARLTARGFRVIRVTWRQLRAEPEAVLVRIAQTLARAEG